MHKEVQNQGPVFKYTFLGIWFIGLLSSLAWLKVVVCNILTPIHHYHNITLVYISIITVG